MKLAVMQPYFFPYLGYFQLVDAVDRFIIYDNIQYTKKGWVNRNRILVSGKPTTITLNVAAGPSSAMINERRISPEFAKEKRRILGRIKSSYSSAENLEEGCLLVEEALAFPSENLFEALVHNVQAVCRYLHIQTPLIRSSEIPIDHEQTGDERVVSICKSLRADTYVNPEGGMGLYDKCKFAEHGVDLKFLKFKAQPYRQQCDDFVSHLSIIDVVLNNPLPRVREMLNKDYDLI